MTDESYILRALELAEEAARAGDVPIGAVLVSGDLVLEAKNEKEARPDATAHAEMLLLREAARALRAGPRRSPALVAPADPSFERNEENEAEWREWSEMLTGLAHPSRASLPRRALFRT